MWILDIDAGNYINLSSLRTLAVVQSGSYWYVESPSQTGRLSPLYTVQADAQDALNRLVRALSVYEYEGV